MTTPDRSRRSPLRGVLLAVIAWVGLLMARPRKSWSHPGNVIALALEGFMLTGAFTATLGTYYSGSPWIGVLCGIAGGLLAGALHAVASIRYRADQIVVGIAINLLAVGMESFRTRCLDGLGALGTGVVEGARRLRSGRDRVTTAAVLVGSPAKAYQ